MPGTTYPTATHYSPHFSKAELRCHCGCKPSKEVDAEMAKLARHLEELRTLAGGGPLHIHDAHRCPAENARVDGAADSQHMYGRAADVHSDAVSHRHLRELALKVPAFTRGGIGLYSWGVHVDHRQNGPARWTGPG